MFASCFGFVLAPEPLYERDDQYIISPELQTNPNSTSQIAEGVVTSIVEWGAFVELDKDGWCAAVLPVSFFQALCNLF